MTAREKSEGAKVARRARNREYAKRRRLDPAFVLVENEKARLRALKRYQADPAYRARVQAANKRSREQNPEKERARNRARAWKQNKLRKYNLTATELLALWEAQGRACPICHRDLVSCRSGHIDHCHTTGRVRGILCNCCNVGLGMFKENALFLTAAITYLENTK